MAHWRNELSEFPWSYSEPETFYVLEGWGDLDRGGSVEFGKGDLVTFTQGVGCRWNVEEPIKKHYRFGWAVGPGRPNMRSREATPTGHRS